jgi:hypothetical protein
MNKELYIKIEHGALKPQANKTNTSNILASKSSNLPTAATNGADS